jgi:hemoglobin
MGRDMKTAHKGLHLSDADWTALLGHVKETLDELSVGPEERAQFVAFIQGTRGDIVES